MSAEDRTPSRQRSAALRPADVPCEGCGEPTPYDAGPADSDAQTYGEWLATPLGMMFARTHRRRECVKAARERHHGRRIDRPLTKAERAARDAQAATP